MLLVSPVHDLWKDTYGWVLYTASCELLRIFLWIARKAQKKKEKENFVSGTWPENLNVKCIFFFGAEVLR